MKFTTSYLLQPKELLSISPEEVAEIILSKFAADTNCKTRLVEGKIVFSREKFLFYTHWLFTRTNDGTIQITRKEPYLAIEGTLRFSNTFLIRWSVAAAFLSAFLIYIGFPIWFVIFWPGIGLAALLSFSWSVSLISFNTFLKTCIGTLGDVIDRKQMEALEKS